MRLFLEAALLREQVEQRLPSTHGLAAQHAGAGSPASSSARPFDHPLLLLPQRLGLATPTVMDQTILSLFFPSSPQLPAEVGVNILGRLNYWDLRRVRRVSRGLDQLLLLHPTLVTRLFRGRVDARAVAAATAKSVGRKRTTAFKIHPVLDGSVRWTTPSRIDGVEVGFDEWDSPHDLLSFDARN